MEVAQLLDSHSDWFSTEGLHFGEMEPLPSIDSDSSLGLFDLLESVQDCRHYSKLSSLPTTHDFVPYSDTSSSDSSSGYDQFGTNESLRLPGFCSFSDATSSMLCFEGLGGVAPKQTIKPQFDPIEWLKNGCTGSYERCSITNEVSSREPPKNKRPPNKCLDQVQTLKRNCVRNENNVDAAVIGTKDPQSIAARNRREKISERLKILQDLVPNGSKVDLVTMLEKAISYVKFLQLQVKILATDEFWPTHGGGVPDIAQVQEAMDAIVSSSNGKC